jgi:FkbM family methyltransferase
MITYAQNFEDVLLARLFHGQSEGFYIDVGAWHPTLHSVTKHFYDRGWSGVNIEPIQSQYRLFVEDRPRDQNLNVAVSDVAGHIRFHQCTDLTSLSTANEKQVEALRLAGHHIESYDVPVVTLNEVMVACGNRSVDFLKVDVEGLEATVLRGLDWKLYRPRVLVIEATLPAVKIEDWDRIDSIRAWDAWEPALLAAGYQFAWYDGLSRFYLRNEDANLKCRLTLPPCVHDEFEFAEVSELKRRYTALVKDRQDVLDANFRLVAEIDALKDERDALKDERDALKDERNSESQKIAAKDQVIGSMAIRDIERKVVLRGVADIAYHWRRHHLSSRYGDYYPAQDAGSGTHVAVDTMEIVFGVSGGVETYMKMLVNALAEGGRQVTLICLPDQLAVLRRQFDSRVGYFVMRQSPAMGLSERLSRLFGKPKPLTAATSMATFSRLREDIGADILHSPVQIFSTLDFHIPSVLNLHDLQHLHFPENFTPAEIDCRCRLYGLSAALADAIIVSSDFVRDDLIGQMRVSPDKVFTVPVTWDPMVIDGLTKFSVQDAAACYKLPPTYAIYPAQFWPHKNHVRLIQALRIVRDKRPGTDLKLVFTGYRGHSGWPAVQATIRGLELDGDVICLDHVPVDHLAALYKGALFCVVPSTFEASSYPVIEAQVLGVPAMCSNVTSLPELMRDGAGLLFDPFDVDDIAANMLQWLDDPKDRQTCAERARSKVRKEHGLENYVASLGRVYDYVLAAHN